MSYKIIILFYLYIENIFCCLCPLRVHVLHLWDLMLTCPCCITLSNPTVRCGYIQVDKKAFTELLGCYHSPSNSYLLGLLPYLSFMQVIIHLLSHLLQQVIMHFGKIFPMSELMEPIIN